MHPYVKKIVEVNKARRALRSSIKRIANKCNFDINIKIYTGSQVIAVWDKSITVVIGPAGVSISPDIPLDKDWSIFIDKLRHLVAAT